jgi:transglutaminase-like putative cysteine protease
MKIDIALTARLEVQLETPAMLQLEVVSVPGYQSVLSSKLEVSPEAPINDFFDIYGNRCQRLMLPSGQTRVEYRASVEQPDDHPLVPVTDADPSVLELPAETLHYLLPSRFCPSDHMLKVSTDLFDTAGNGGAGSTPSAGYARVLRICDWIYKNVSYGYGTSNAGTTAINTFIDRQGVCRDFAHLAITFCRALNIPARYVSGYCLGLEPPDFHAFFHAYVGGRWVVFDATQRQPRPSLVQVAMGRDAGDCAWSTFYGTGQTNELTVTISSPKE